MTYYYFTAAVILMLVGLVGVVIPAVPGIPLMASVAIIFHFIVKPMPLWSMFALIAITLISVVIDHFSGIFGSKFAGANGKSMLPGLLGMFLFIGFYPPLGSIIGLFIGILVAELFFKKTPRKAVKAASAGAISIILGMVINIILALIFLGIFIFGALR